MFLSLFLFNPEEKWSWNLPWCHHVDKLRILDKRRVFFLDGEFFSYTNYKLTLLTHCYINQPPKAPLRGLVKLYLSVIVLYVQFFLPFFFKENCRNTCQSPNWLFFWWKFVMMELHSFCTSKAKELNFWGLFGGRGTSHIF